MADEKDDDDADEHERDAAVPTTPASSNAYSCHGGTHDPLVDSTLRGQMPQAGRESSESKGNL